MQHTGFGIRRAGNVNRTIHLFAIAKGIGKVYCKGTPFFAEVETRRIVRRGKLFPTLVPLAKDVLGLKRKIQVSVAIGY